MKSVLSAIACLGLFFATELKAQWLVYDMSITGAQGVNLELFEKAQLVMPLYGGPVSMVFYGPDKEFAVSRNGGRYFPVLGKETRRFVFSAIIHQGTSQGLYYMDAAAVPVRLPIFGKEEPYVIPEQWEGTFMVCDPESEQDPAADGTVGFAGTARLSAVLNMPLTRLANVTPRPLEKQLAELSTRLLENGYRFLSDSAESTATMQKNNPLIDPSLFPQ
jgi:hypothetical protein